MWARPLAEGLKVTASLTVLVETGDLGRRGRFLNLYQIATLISNQISQAAALIQIPVRRWGLRLSYAIASHGAWISPF
jgi:hypothetical protein